MKSTCKYFLLSFLLCLSALPSVADEVTLYDGQIIVGQIIESNETSLSIEIKKPEKKTEVISLFNVVKFRFDEQPMPQERSQLLIDGWDKPSEKLTSKKVKFRKGYHRLTLPFLHRTGTAKLKVSIQKTGGSKREISPRILYATPSALWGKKSAPYQIDKDGFRTAIDVTDMKLENNFSSRATYWESFEVPKDLGDLRIKALDEYKRTSKFTIPKMSNQEHFSLVFGGLLRITSDGEYTFFVEADGNSQFQLYTGDQPSRLYGQRAVVKSEDWQVRFSKKGKLVGRFKSWDEKELQFDINLNSKNYPVPLENSTLEEIWKAKNPETVNRDGEPDDVDSLYAKDKSGNIQRISGEVLGLEEGKVKFKYLGEDRKISLDKIVGFVLKKNRNLPEESPNQVVQLLGPYQIPGTLLVTKSWTRKIRFPSGRVVPFGFNQIVHVELANSRLQSLAEMEPASVNQVPYFTRKIPFSSNKSLEGKTLRIGSKTYPLGLCVHSKTVLEYSLDEKYETFKCEIGLQHETGKLGNVAVQVLGDEQVLYENKELTIKSKNIPLNLKVSGKKKLRLVVDFGKNQDVGDRLVWGNPQLIRTPIKEDNKVSAVKK